MTAEERSERQRAAAIRYHHPPHQPRPWALVIWVGPALAVYARYFYSRAEAVAAAPVGEPYAVVDISRRAEPRLTVEQVLAIGRGVIEIDNSLHPGRRGEAVKAVCTCLAPGCEQTFMPRKDGHQFCSTDCRNVYQLLHRKEQRKQRADAVAATIAQRAKEKTQGVPAYQPS
jgi:hypothetical protein